MILEDDLRRAFRRQPAPPDLAQRVLARVEQGRVAPPTRVPASPRAPAVRWLAAAAAIAMVAVGGTQYYRSQQAAAEAERIHNEVRLALQIAGEKLALVQRKLEEPRR